MNAIARLYFFVLLLTCMDSCAKAAPLPKSYPIYLELFCADKTRWRDRTGCTYYIWVTDIYTKERKMVHPRKSENGHVVFEYDVYNPTYNVVNTNTGKTIPFYVEPYDSLVIDIDNMGYPLLFRKPDGSQYAYANMLTHDISNNKLYTLSAYDDDRDHSTFSSFSDNLLDKMNHALDSINRIADFYRFTDKERSIALCNARAQYLLWLFEFSTFRSHMLQEYASTHTAGWQNLDTDDKETDEIRDPKNYMCMNPLLADDQCLASRFIDVFLNDYENSEILRHDLYLYAGDTHADSLRMDSALCARDMQITGVGTPSPLIRIINERKYMEIPDDYGIMLKEAKIIASRSPLKTENTRTFITQRDIEDAKSFQMPTGFNVLGLIGLGVQQTIKLFRGKKQPKPSNQNSSNRQKILDSWAAEDKLDDMIRKGVR